MIRELHWAWNTVIKALEGQSKPSRHATPPVITLLIQQGALSSMHLIDGTADCDRTKRYNYQEKDLL